MRRWLGVWVGIVMSAGTLAAQRGGPAGIVRDPGDSSQTGTHRLAGRVLDAQTDRPLRRAVVQITTGNLQEARWTRTDADGRWVLDAVLPRAYTVTASRDGFVTMSFGQKSAFGAPVTVRVPDDQGLDRLDITLPRGGVIAGRIADEFGEPLARAGVQAMRVRFVDGQRQLVPMTSGISELASGGFALTDDRGEYRLFGLAPGTYFVSAMYGPSVPGQFDDRTSYPQTYYPGTTSVADAGPVTISPDEPSMASFALSPTTLSVVAGRVLTSAGQGALARVSLRPVAPGHALQVGAPLSQASSGSEGVFTIRGVPSGTYVLQAQVNAGPELASYPVVVSGQDVRDLIVTTVQAGSVSGRLSLEGDIGELSPSRFAVQALPMGVGALSGRGGGGPASAGNTATGRANAGGEFAVGALLGRQLLRLAPPLTPDGWWLKAVTVDGKDVTDSGVEIRSGENVTAVEVIATTRMASLTGPVTERSGARVPGCSVVAFAADEAKWGPRTRFVVAGTTDDNGTFLLRGLPAGEYVVVAVPPLEAGDETDPERLARWRPAGQRVTLADGEARSVALTISR